MGWQGRLAAALSSYFLKGKDPRAVHARNLTYAALWTPSNQPQPDAFALAQLDTTNPVFYACVQRIAEDAAGTPLKLVVRAADGSVQDAEPTHPAAALLTQHINPVESPFCYWTQIYADLLIEGNHFSWLNVQGGKPLDMVRMRPEQVVVDPDPVRMVSQYRWLTPENPEGEPYAPELVLHFKTRNPDTYLRGLGVAPRLRDYLTMEREMVGFQQRRFANDLAPEIIVTTTAKFSDDDLRARVEDTLDRRFNAKRNGGKRWAMLEEGLWNFTVVPRATEQEIGYMQSMNWLRNVYAMAFGIPPNKLGDWSESSGLATNAGEQERLYWEDTIQQWHRLVVDTLNSNFLARYWPAEVARGLEFAFDYSHVKALNTSATEQTDIWTRRITGAMATPNEAREAVGMERVPDEAADLLYMGQRQLGAADEQAQAMLEALQEQGGPGGPQKPEEDEKPGGKVVSISYAKGTPWEPVDEAGERARLADAVRAEIRRMVAQAGQQQLDLDNVIGGFNLRDPLVLAFVERQVLRMSQEVVATTSEMVRKALAEALEAGEPIADMRAAVQAAYKTRRLDWQLDRVARTEVHHAQEGGSWMAAKQAGVEYKIWLTARDDRVRGLDPADTSDHEGLEGSVVKLDDCWTDPRSGAQLQYPGDREGKGAGPGDTINCRCTWAADFSHLDQANVELVLAAGYTLAVQAKNAADNATAIWGAKALTRERWEAALKRTLRRFLLGMEERTLSRFDEQTGSVYAVGR